LKLTKIPRLCFKNILEDFTESVGPEVFEAFKTNRKLRDSCISDELLKIMPLEPLPELNEIGTLFLQILDEHSRGYNTCQMRCYFWVSMWRRNQGHLSYSLDYINNLTRVPAFDGVNHLEIKLYIKTLEDVIRHMENRIFGAEIAYLSHEADLLFDPLELGPPAYLLQKTSSKSKRRKTVVTISSREAPVFNLASELRPDPVVMGYIKDNYPGSPVTQDD
jgi:hypothetical protein